MSTALLLLTLAQTDPLVGLAAEVTPSVVHVVIKGPLGEKLGSGTGFFVSNDGLVATNAHVVDDASAITVELVTGEKREATGLVAVDVDHDVALLRVPGPSKALRLGSSLELQPGTSVLSVGGPAGLAFSATTGIVGAVRKEMEEEEREAAGKYFRNMGRVIQLSSASRGGASGSPVLTTDGQVIGILHAGMGEMLTFLSPIENLEALIAAQGAGPITPFSTVASSSALATDERRNLLVSGIFFVALAIVAGVLLQRSRAAERSKRKHLLD